MALTEEQYERIARWLDGESVELSAEERAAAEEVRGAEARLAGPMREVEVPARAMARARRRLAAATARPTLRARRVAVAAGAAAVAAAAVIALLMFLGGPERQKADRDLVGDQTIPVEVWVATVQQTPGGDDIALLADELDKLEAELAWSESAQPLDRQIESLTRELEQFWLEDSPDWASDG